MGQVAPGWYADPAGRWQMRWWDGARWTDQVASGGRRGIDPAPGGDETAELVNRVMGTALGFVELDETLPAGVPEADVTTALWRDAQTRRDILVLAQGHLATLEQRGSQPARAKALTYITRSLASPPPMRP